MSRLKAHAGLAPETRMRRVRSVLPGSKTYWEVFDDSRNEWRRLRVLG